jgi:hypothetical protein
MRSAGRLPTVCVCNPDDDVRIRLDVVGKLKAALEA